MLMALQPSNDGKRELNIGLLLRFIGAVFRLLKLFFNFLVFSLFADNQIIFFE